MQFTSEQVLPNQNLLMPASEYTLHIKKETGKNVLRHLLIQRKMSIGAVDDPLEHEADAIADKVMRLPDQNFIQRKCTHCNEKEKAHRKPLASFIQKKESTNNNVVACDAVSRQIQSSKGGGSSMPTTTKSFMENRLELIFLTCMFTQIIMRHNYQLS